MGNLNTLSNIILFAELKLCASVYRLQKMIAREHNIMFIFSDDLFSESGYVPPTLRIGLKVQF